MLTNGFNTRDRRTHSVWVGSLSLTGSTGVTLAVGLMLAGVLARYFSPEEFGLWSILMSLNGILVSGFDFGFGNALRNKLAKIYSRKETGEEEGPAYFFSIFYWFLLSALVLTGLFFILKPYIPWGILFHTQRPEVISQGSSLMILGASILSFNIAFSLFTPGFFAYQESHWNGLLNGLSRGALLLTVLLLVLARWSFYWINFVFFLVTLAASVFCFFIYLKRRRWKWRRIPLRAVGSKVKELWLPSLQFALLQTFSIFLLNVDYFIVSKIWGLEVVGEYFLVKRVYLVLASFHFALLLPVWSAYTESLEVGDYAWSWKKLRQTAFYTIMIFGLGLLLMNLVGDWLVYLWTGKKVEYPSLFLWLGLWGLASGWGNCFSVFLNGTGRLRRQVACAGVGALMVIPLSIYLGEKFGVAGIALTLIATSLPAAFSNSLETLAVFRKPRRGEKNSSLGESLG